jgi:hypothetical protein
MCLFSEFRVVMSVAISAYLLYLSLFTHSGVQDLLCCIFLRHVPYVASFSGLSFFDCPSIFSDVYLHLLMMLSLFMTPSTRV